jgi:hypothetical protein
MRKCIDPPQYRDRKGETSMARVALEDWQDVDVAIFNLGL